jgi:hypothetical protein
MTDTRTTTHQMTTTEASTVLLAYDSHSGEPGGILIVDTAEGLKAHYTTNPGNMAGRMVMIDTLTPLDPPELRTPVLRAQAVNAALDDAEDGTDDRDQTSAESGPHWNQHAAAILEDSQRRADREEAEEARLLAALESEAERADVCEQPTRTTSHRTTMEEAEDNPSTFEGEVTTGRTYETQTLALELANLEPLYKGARGAIKASRTPGHREVNDADALEAYVAGILEDQDTRNPRTALLVALANAATCRIDWSDVAAQLIEVDEISEEELEAAAAMMDRLTGRGNGNRPLK